MPISENRRRRLDELADQLDRQGFIAQVNPRGYVVTLEPDIDPQDPRTEWGAAEDDPDTRAYLEGDVCGWTIRDASGDVLDSCWGYYGEHDYPLELAHGECRALPNMARGAHRFPRLAMVGPR